MLHLQLVTCLTVDPGVASSIPVQSHTFVEIDREIISTLNPPISTVILLPSAGSRSVTKYWLTA